MVSGCSLYGCFSASPFSCVQWCVLPCGHSICVACIEQMQKNNSPSKWPFSRRKEIRCPVCRVWVRNNEINIVSTLGGQGNSSGTKVEVNGACTCTVCCEVVCECVSVCGFASVYCRFT